MIPENHCKARRLALRITQREVAYAAGIGIQQYQKIENHMADPRLSTCVGIARSFHCSLDELFGTKLRKASAKEDLEMKTRAPYKKRRKR